MLLEALIVLWTLQHVGHEINAFRLEQSRYLDMWNLVDASALVLLVVWIGLRLVWWFEITTTSPDLDLTATDAYVGWFQGLARLLQLQQAIVAVGLILSWLRMQESLRMLP